MAARTAVNGTTDFGWTGRVFFPAQWELPKEEAWKIMGWDKTWDARVATAKQLMIDAGYANGFKLSPAFSAGLFAN
jgi:hypothetical protein